MRCFIPSHEAYELVGALVVTRWWGRWSKRRALALVLGMVLMGLGVWGFWYEPGQLVVREERLVIPRWPVAASGMRIVVLTDLHVGAPHVGMAQLERIVERTNALKPDLVCILGDLVIQKLPC